MARRQTPPLVATLLVAGLAFPGGLAAQEQRETDPHQGHDHQSAERDEPDPGAPSHQGHAHEADAERQRETRTFRHEGHADHTFDDVERYVAMFESPERAEWQMPDRVVEALGIGRGNTVSDVGSGTGYFARRFASAVGAAGTVFASDIEPGMAGYVRDRADREGQANLVPVLASLDDPRLPDGASDLIFLCNTWHHISDRPEYARRLRRDLAEGGRVVIVDFVPGELPVGPPPGEKLSAEQVANEFRKAGYRLAASPDFLPYQYVLIFEPAQGG